MQNRITPKVIKPINKFIDYPKFSDVDPPAMYLIAVGYNDNPIVKTTVPATKGGNNFLKGLISATTIIASIPPTNCTPNMDSIP